MQIEQWRNVETCSENLQEKIFKLLENTIWRLLYYLHKPLLHENKQMALKRK